MTDQTRIEKVQKLLALAEKAGSQEEAELAFAKAQDLMTKWAIDEAMLAAQGKADDDEIVREHIKLKRPYFRANTMLFSGIAKANGAKLLSYPYSRWNKYGMAGVELIGWKSDLERIKMMYASIQMQLYRERKRELPEWLREEGGEAVTRWRNSFSEGYAEQLSRRLREQARRTQEQRVKEDYSGSLLPAVMDRQERVDAFFAGISTTTLKARKRHAIDFAAYGSGVEAANRADIGNTRVGKTERKSIR